MRKRKLLPGILQKPGLNSRRILIVAFLGALASVTNPATAPAAHIDPTVIDNISVGLSPQGVGVNPTTNRVYVANGSDNTVSVIDGATDTVITTITVGSFPIGVGVNPTTNRVYVANYSSNTVSVIDGATSAVSATITVGSQPLGVGVNPATDRVYVSNISSNTLSVIDGASNAVIATIPVGQAPYGVGVNPTTSRVYVANFSSNTVSVIDETVDVVVATIPGFSIPTGVGVNPLTNRTYVASFAIHGPVWVIDGTTNSVIATITPGGQYDNRGIGVAVNPTTNFVYAAYRAGDGTTGAVVSINGATNSVAADLVLCCLGASHWVGVNPLTDRVYVSLPGWCCDPSTAHWVSVIADRPTPATLTLAPLTATNTVGVTHCVTATVKDASGNPMPGITVRFSVAGAQTTFSTPSSGSAITNTSGEAEFCFTASLPGDNAIHAFADSNNNNAQDLGEPFGDASKTWILPGSTQFCEVTITDGGWIVANNGDKANFGGSAKVLANGTVQGQQRYADQGPIQPMVVSSIELTATTCNDARTTASIFGRATIDGAGSHVFRIDVTDMSKLGSSDSYGITLDTGYMSGQHDLGGGQITIH